MLTFSIFNDEMYNPSHLNKIEKISIFFSLPILSWVQTNGCLGHGIFHAGIGGSTGTQYALQFKICEQGLLERYAQSRKIRGKERGLHRFAYSTEKF